MVRLGLELVIGLWLGLWLRVRFRVKVMVRVVFMVRVGVRIRVNLTLTKTLEPNLNLLSYWDCCQNMVMKKMLQPGHLTTQFMINASQQRCQL